MAHAVGSVGSPRVSSALERVGAFAAAISASVLFLGIVGSNAQQSAIDPRNWLVVLFQINAGTGSLPTDPMRVINPLDIPILVLVGLTFLGLWPTLGREHRIWTGLATALPFIGIAVLLVTGQAGRSAVMGAGIVISVLLFVSAERRVLLASVGLLANALLLAGDFGTGVVVGWPLAVVLGIGYVLLLAWFVLLAVNFPGLRRADGAWDGSR